MVQNERGDRMSGYISISFSLSDVLSQFAFKYVILTIALWIPAVLKSSARESQHVLFVSNPRELSIFPQDFTYAQKGLWYEFYHMDLKDSY